MNTGAIASEVNQKDRAIKNAESRNIDSQHRLSIFFRSYPAFFIATHNSVRSGKLLCNEVSLGERENNISINCIDTERYIAVQLKTDLAIHK